MPKTNLQQQAVSLIEQLSAEKLKMAVDYLTYLYDNELWEAKQEFASVRPIDEEVPAETATTADLGPAIHTLFKPFGGVELEIPPREPARERQTSIRRGFKPRLRGSFCVLLATSTRLPRVNVSNRAYGVRSASILV